MNHEQLKRINLQLMEKVSASVLTTVDSDGYPQTRAMLNLRDKKQFPELVGLFEDHQEDFLLYFTTGLSSGKIKEIENNPNVSVYFCDAGIYHGLMLGGKIEIIQDKEIKKAIWHEDWTMYYPGGIDGPEYGILRLKPSIAKGWYQRSAFEFSFNGES